MSNIDEGVQYWTYVKRYWNDSWQLANYLVPEQFSVEICPGIGSATFSHHAGMIKREDGNNYFPYSGYDLTGWYVKIITRYGSQQAETAFIGKIVDRKDILLDSAGLVFDQIYSAFELTYDLDRLSADRFLARNPMDPNKPNPFFGFGPTFNKRSEFGGKLAGNRSPALNNSLPFAGCHFFYDLSDGRKWSALDVLKYIVHFLLKDPEDTIPFYTFLAPEFTENIFLSGQYSALDGIKRIWDFSERSIFDALNDVINRSAGFAWNLNVVENSQGQDATFYINVKSVSRYSISLGGVTIPANNDTTTLQLPTDFPFTHLVNGIQARENLTSTYGAVEVIGGPISVTSTFAVGSDQEMVPAWIRSFEEEYREIDGEDATEKDEKRASEIFDGFYTKFVLRDQWDGAVTVPLAGKNYILPAVDPYTGEISFPQQPTPFWPGDKKFEREISLPAGYDHSKDPPRRMAEVVARDEMMPMMGFVEDVLFGDLHDPTERIVPLDRIEDYIPELPISCNVRPLDKQIGFEISISPRHLMALPDWDNDEDETNHYPEFSWAFLYLTATLQTDTLLRKIVVINEQLKNKKLTLHVPDAEAWAVRPETLVGGGFYPTYKGPLFVRDDRPELDGIAAAAAAWHGIPRQAVSISVTRVSHFGVRVGQMMTSITGQAAVVGVNSIITALRTDIRAGTTTIDTSWGNQDYSPNFVSFFTGPRGG